MQAGINVFIAFSNPSGSCTQYSGTCGINDTITFTASSFGYDFNCATHTFTWNFGDGQSASGKQVTHKYSGNGTFPVTLTINNGAQNVPVTANVVVGAGGTPTPTPSCNANPIQINPSALPAATVGRSYSQVLTATGGTPPFAFSLADGVLPPGLNVNQNTIFGTPLIAGSFAFSIKATDARSCVGIIPYGMSVIASTCSDMIPGVNVFLNFSGAKSRCSDSHEMACVPSELIEFAVSGASYDFSCLEHTFIWNFGDGQIAAGNPVTHTYIKPGRYDVTLVISNARQLAQLTTTITLAAPRRRPTRH